MFTRPSLSATRASTDVSSSSVPSRTSPYERPPLSKGYLRGEGSLEKLRLRPEGFWAEQEIELRLGVRVARIDPGSREVELEGGERIALRRGVARDGWPQPPTPAPGDRPPGGARPAHAGRRGPDARRDRRRRARRGRRDGLHRLRDRGVASPARARGDRDRAVHGAARTRARRRGRRHDRVPARAITASGCFSARAWPHSRATGV